MTQNRLEQRREVRLAVETAESFDAEQRAMAVAPCVDILLALPQDRGQVWELHTVNFEADDYADCHAIVKRLGLSYERGRRLYYVLRVHLAATVRELNEAGFNVALCGDAAGCLGD